MFLRPSPHRGFGRSGSGLPNVQPVVHIEDFPRCIDGKSREICDDGTTACGKFSTQCTTENIEYDEEFNGEIGREKGLVEVNITGIPVWNDFISIGFSEGGNQPGIICQLW